MVNKNVVKRTWFFLWCLLLPFWVDAALLTGQIKTEEGKILPFASIQIKGSSRGVTANKDGAYAIELSPGQYTLVAQYVGYTTKELKLNMGRVNQTLDFVLSPQTYTLNDVVVVAGGEDPAYAIIRKAIAAREVHRTENRQFTCEVYIKGQLQLRDYPKKFLGQKVDFEDGDSSKRKMLLLSETLANYSVQEPNRKKIEVISTKLSGQSDGYGFSNPQIISFYENNITLGRNLNPRGFVSPLADNALQFYRYQFKGSFYENGLEISRIKVIPKRKYEPLFSGYINIIENQWRLQSVDLTVLKDQQMQFLDTLQLQQIFVPIGSAWVVKQQLIAPAGKFFGFDFFGSFIQVYDKYDLAPRFGTKYFTSTLLKYQDSANKKSLAYWDSLRPLPLLVEEKRDYQKKDSLETLRKDPRYLDSLDRKNNRIRPLGILVTGQDYTIRKKKIDISYGSLLSTFTYNTVEGGVLRFDPVLTKSWEGRKSLSIRPELRYGLANAHFNPNLSATYTFGKKYIQQLTLAGGRKVFQYNNAEPITNRANLIYTLLAEQNFLKIYEANFFRVAWGQGLGNGLTWNANFQFQDRFALDNLPRMISWVDKNDRSFTPNYPTELLKSPMARHQAAQLTLGLSWRPGAKYIEYPDRKVFLGSRWPSFSAAITQGIKGILGSDVDFSRWRFAVEDDLNMKLGGRLQYRLAMGGFFQSNAVYTPDLNHFLGNQTIFANSYLNRFQLAGYYRYSNTASFFSNAHLEYHLNGWLTNKIPGFKKLNWFLVVGGNGLTAG
ncbi:MAG: carboxypeptidase-like regulatory domain-containing protein, partial [Sphingobacteriia bacterium]